MNESDATGEMSRREQEYILMSKGMLLGESLYGESFGMYYYTTPYLALDMFARAKAYTENGKLWSVTTGKQLKIYYNQMLWDTFPPEY